MPRVRYRHLFLGEPSADDYTYPHRTGGSRTILPYRDRAIHGATLAEELARVQEALHRLRDQRHSVLGLTTERGTYLEVRSTPGFKLAVESLDLRKQGIQLMSVRELPDGQMRATIFVAPGKLVALENRIKAYLNEDTARGKPKHKTLVESISEIHAAALAAFWTDAANLLPAHESGDVWWEVWLRDDAVTDFLTHANALGITVGQDVLVFPERQVLIARATRAKMERSIELLDCIAELRRPKEAPSFFMDLTPLERQDWVYDLRTRTTAAGKDAPAVCLLDTGVNSGHPLLRGLLDEDCLHACNPDWGAADHHGHGTAMAGVALFGDLQPLLSSSMEVRLEHRLESVKLLPAPKFSENDKRLYGSLTSEAVARAELAHPFRARTVCLTVTSADGRDRGQPTSWSAEIDRLASGHRDDRERLFVISAGTVPESEWDNYPDYNDVAQVEDPAQSWNAVTVGAFTERFALDPARRDGWKVLAPRGTLSPSSPTSHAWRVSSPNKPDVVFEGGNGAVDSRGGFASSFDELSSLTISSSPREEVLQPVWGTSPAAADAARMAAIISARYPRLWPQTVRALIVHSADWTAEMREESRMLRPAPSDQHDFLLRRYGYGVPNLERACWSAGDTLTLIAQEAIQPFHKPRGEAVKTRDLHMHSLPWPVSQLQALGEIEVELRVTLSYFVEPAPSGRSMFHSKFRYQSHGLRFALAKSSETLKEFQARVSKDAQESEFEIPQPGEPGWTIGAQLRNRGSLHSDRCLQTAAEIAQRRYLAVYPVGGWWKERPHLGRFESTSRYALVVSIVTPQTGVDIYVPVAAQLELPIEVVV